MKPIIINYNILLEVCKEKGWTEEQVKKKILQKECEDPHIVSVIKKIKEEGKHE